jgi:hypothetical protein
MILVRANRCGLAHGGESRTDIASRAHRGALAEHPPTGGHEGPTLRFLNSSLLPELDAPQRKIPSAQMRKSNLKILRNEILELRHENDAEQ